MLKYWLSDEMLGVTLTAANSATVVNPSVIADDNGAPAHRTSVCSR